MLMALLDILDCSMEDLIEPFAAAGAGGRPEEEGGRRRGQRRRPASQAGPHSRRAGGRDQPRRCERAVCDPIGLITELVAAAEPGLAAEQIRAVVTAVAGGRAKSRRLASALAERPAVLADGRSPAPRAVGDLLVALREAGARSVSPPCCARCGKQLRTFQRRGQDWYCAPCEQRAEPCAACGKVRPVSSRDRAGQPRCAKCPEADGRDPVTVIHGIITGLDPQASRDAVAAAVRRSAPRPSYQQKLAWALEDNPRLLTGEGIWRRCGRSRGWSKRCMPPGSAGIVRPACPGCHRVVRIDKPLDGVRVCRTCIAHARTEQCARCGARREPVTRDDQGRPLCANCFITDPANLETCIGCGRRRRVATAHPGRAAVLPLPHAAAADVLHLRPDHAVRHLPRHRPAVVPGLPAADGCLLGLRPPRADRLRHPGRSALRRLHPAPGLGRLPGLQRPRPSQPRPVRPLPDQPAPGRADGSARPRPAPRAAGPAPRARRRRAPRHGDALADQAVHRARAGRPCRGPHPADPPGPRRACPKPGPGPSAADARRRRRPARPRRGNDPARSLPGRADRLPARHRAATAAAPLPDLAPGQAAAQPQQRPARHPAAVPHDPPAGPRRRRVPGLARRPRPHPGQLPASRPGPLARR